jgi:nicotinamidase-related amidase
MEIVEMIEVAGKVVFTTLEELVDPKHTALLIVDLQNDFCHPDGACHKVEVDTSAYESVIAGVEKVLETARKRSILVVHIQLVHLPNFLSDSPSYIRFRLKLQEMGHSALLPVLEGTWGAEIIEPLKPKPGELAVIKRRSSAFWGTDLDMLLRSNGIQTVVMSGCTTEGCVESTARDAMFADYYVVVLEDCVGTDDPAQHEASLLLMRHRFDISTSDEVIRIWSN